MLRCSFSCTLEGVLSRVSYFQVQERAGGGRAEKGHRRWVPKPRNPHPGGEAEARHSAGRSVRTAGAGQAGERLVHISPCPQTEIITLTQLLCTVQGQPGEEQADPGEREQRVGLRCEESATGKDGVRTQEEEDGGPASGVHVQGHWGGEDQGRAGRTLAQTPGKHMKLHFLVS